MKHQGFQHWICVQDIQAIDDARIFRKGHLLYVDVIGEKAVTATADAHHRSVYIFKIHDFMKCFQPLGK